MRRIGRILFGLGCVAAAVLGTASGGFPKDGKEQEEQVIKTENNIHFLLPPDWPIEEIGKIRRPIAVEDYVYRKFTAVEKRLQDLEQKISGLDVRLRVWEEQAKARSVQGLRSKEGKTQ